MPDAAGDTLTRRIGRYGACYALAAAGGALFQWIGVPLPWMLGALFATATARLGGLPVEASRPARNVGALVIGCALGLFFTPVAAAALLADAPTIVGAALATIGVGLALAPVLVRLARIDRTTAMFASMPGGVAEMAMLSEAYGARPTIVAVLQLLRIVGVVVLVPLAIALISGLHRDAAIRATAPLYLPGLVLLVALGGCATFVLMRLRVKNAWVLGGLSVGLAFTAADVSLSGMPLAVTAAAQILMGADLGAQFERATFVGGRRLLAAAAAHVLMLTVCCCAVGLAIAAWRGWSFATLALATAPGGVAEMSITAKTMGLDVAAVVAFHLVRIFLTAMLVQPIVNLWRRLGWA